MLSVTDELDHSVNAGTEGYYEAEPKALEIPTITP